VVGNLAVWFALQVIFRDHEPVRAGPLVIVVPVPGSVDLAALGLAVLAAICLFGLKRGVLQTLGITAAAGLILRLAINM
jgi:chromate transporter